MINAFTKLTVYKRLTSVSRFYYEAVQFVVAIAHESD